MDPQKSFHPKWKVPNVKQKTKFVAISSQANYIDHAAAIVGEATANFSDREVSRDQRNGSPRPLISVFQTGACVIIQVAPQLSSRGWVDPVSDSLLLRKSGSARNGTRDLRICSQ
jgi:hypothetical protein